MTLQPPIPVKVLEYEHFLNEVLRKDLGRVQTLEEKIYNDLSNYLQIRTFVEQLKEQSFGNRGDSSLKLKSDLGSNFYVNCVIPDTKYIHIYCGLGFYVQLSHDEAIRFIDKKEEQLRDEMDALAQQENKIKAHIKLVLEGLRELQQLP